MQQLDATEVIPSTVLAGIAGRSLFYPCSWNDCLAPVELFAPTVNEFWFVDKDYFRSDTDRRSSYDAPLLALRPKYQQIEDSFSGPVRAVREDRVDPETGKRRPYLEIGIRTEQYVHAPSGQTITIRRCRGYGPTVLRENIPSKSLGVFYYRGDSGGEGGSGTLWLTVAPGCVRLIDEVLERLVDGGLIVTDGSNCHKKDNPYSEFGKFYKNRVIGREAMSFAQHFSDSAGNQFHCVGYAGENYGPTLVWRVEKAGQVTPRRVLNKESQ